MGWNEVFEAIQTPFALGWVYLFLAMAMIDFLLGVIRAIKRRKFSLLYVQDWVRDDLAWVMLYAVASAFMGLCALAARGQPQFGYYVASGGQTTLILTVGGFFCGKVIDKLHELGLTGFSADVARALTGPQGHTKRHRTAKEPEGSAG
jgi:hypothetical protein